MTLDTLNDEWKGHVSAGFLLLHAWRRKFHVSGVGWRGGAIHALVQSARCGKCTGSGEQLAEQCPSGSAERAKTYVWFDIFYVNQHLWFGIFCVHQHLRSPSCGLLAFALEPLWNAVMQSDRGDVP